MKPEDEEVAFIGQHPGTDKLHNEVFKSDRYRLAGVLDTPSLLVVACHN